MKNARIILENMDCFLIPMILLLLLFMIFLKSKKLLKMFLNSILKNILLKINKLLYSPTKKNGTLHMFSSKIKFENYN